MTPQRRSVKGCPKPIVRPDPIPIKPPRFHNRTIPEHHRCSNPPPSQFPAATNDKNTPHPTPTSAPTKTRRSAGTNTKFASDTIGHTL